MPSDGASDSYTRPERGCEIARARAIRARIRDDGGCCYCTRRDQTFEGLGRRAACGLTPARRFPVCVEQPGGFEFDEEAFPA